MKVVQRLVIAALAVGVCLTLGCEPSQRCCTVYEVPVPGIPNDSPVCEKDEVGYCPEDEPSSNPQSVASPPGPLAGSSISNTETSE
jgi:hypothetical protein